MAVEGLKKIYETPFIKGRVDIVKEQSTKKEERKGKKKKSPPAKEDNESTPRRKGLIDIRA